MSLRFGMDEGSATIIPLKSNVTLEVVGVLLKLALEFGLCDLLPSVEILEIVVLEVIKNEVFVLWGGHEG